MKDKILDWLATEDVGISSESMAFAALGIENRKGIANEPPSDAADLNRCLILVEQVPEIKLHFNKIAKLGPQWEVLIEQWDILAATFKNEAGLNWSKANSAPNTYALMKGLGF